MEEKKQQIYKIIMIIAITVFITFMVTSISLYLYLLENPSVLTLSSSSSANTNSIATSLKSYRDIIDKYYLGDVDEENLKEGAIKGYIEGLGDPYTEYISKDEMQK